MGRKEILGGEGREALRHRSLELQILEAAGHGVERRARRVPGRVDRERFAVARDRGRRLARLPLRVAALHERQHFGQALGAGSLGLRASVLGLDAEPMSERL